MDKSINLYKIVIKPDSEKGLNPFQFCIDNQILGCGWRLYDDADHTIIPKSLEENEKLGRLQYPNRKGLIQVIHSMKEIKNDDLIWTRNQGIYYLCRVMETWHYGDTVEHRRNDLLNILGVEFIKVGTVDKVPGKVVNSFRARSAIQRIHGSDEKHPSLEASKRIYNEMSGKLYYNVTPKIKENVLELLLPEDMEEVISLYLQIEKNYLIYTSTNKIDTEKYEFVAVARDGTHTCYPQVKTGNVALNFTKYDELAQNGNKVILFATSQNYIMNSNPDIIALSKAEIIDFMYSNKVILPERIQIWM